MLRTILASMLAFCLLGSVGCGSQPQWEPAHKEELFKPAAMRIHPVFTQIRDWTNDGRPDGVEVLIEFQDQFGDPAKTSGNVVFELYQYRAGFPDIRGARVTSPFLASLDNVAAQRERWNRTSRCYSFQLAYPGINPRMTYVLSCTFEATGGGGFTDRIVLEPPAPETSQPATSPAGTPGVRNPAP